MVLNLFVALQVNCFLVVFLSRGQRSHRRCVCTMCIHFWNLVQSSSVLHHICFPDGSWTEWPVAMILSLKASHTKPSKLVFDWDEKGGESLDLKCWQWRMVARELEPWWEIFDNDQLLVQQKALTCHSGTCLDKSRLTRVKIESCWWGFTLTRHTTLVKCVTWHLSSQPIEQSKVQMYNFLEFLNVQSSWSANFLR